MKKRFRLGPNQRRWLSALESGRYRQARSTLANYDGYCCLGVAARVVCGVPRKKLIEQDRGSLEKPEYKKLGLRNGSGSARCTQHVSLMSCVTMNDDQALNFKEIAAYIRKNAPAFFTRSA